MREFLKILSTALITAVLAGSSMAYAVGAFPVATGGTGWVAFTSGALIYGNGTSRLGTTTAATAGQILMYNGSIPKWVSSATTTGTVTSIATTFPIQGGPITNTGTLTFGGFGTTSPWTQGGVVTAGPNQNSGYTTATNTISGSGVITVTAGASVLSAVPITVACPTCSITTGTVTSVSGGTGISGTVTSSGSLSLVSYLATSSAETAGQLAAWGSSNGVPAKLYSIATTSQSDSVAFSDSGTLGAAVGGSTNVRSSVIQPGFFVATSTAWTGTTTVILQAVNLAETINGIRCHTNVGTLNIQTGIGTASTTMLNASSTANFNAFTTSNTTSAGNFLYIDIGTPASSPTSLTCTYKITI